MAFVVPPFLSASTWMETWAWVSVCLGASQSERVAPLAAAALIALHFWPLACLALDAAWRRIPRELWESEPALHGWALLRHLLWPEARGVVALMFMVSVVLAMNHFTIPSLLQVKVLLAEVWVGYSTQLSAVDAWAAGWPLVVLPIVLLWLFRNRPFETVHSTDRLEAPCLSRGLGPSWVRCTRVVTFGTLGVSMVWPLLAVTGSASTWTALVPAFLAAVRPLWLSFAYSGLAATALVGVSLACQCAPGVQRVPAKGWGWISWILWTLFLVPGFLLALGLLTIGTAWPALDFIRQSPAWAFLGLLVHYAAIGWAATALALSRVDRDLLNSAELLPISRWCRLRRIILPQVSGRIAAAWYCVYLLALWDVEIPLLLQAPGGETLALRIFNLLHYGHNTHVNALCMLLLLLASLPAFVWGLWRWIWSSACAAQGHRLPSLGILLGVSSCLVSTGCSPNPPPHDGDLSSRLFRRVEQVGTRGTASGEFNKPRSVTVDRKDNLYVVDMTGRVQKFSPEGVFLLLWQLPKTDLGKPKGMSCDSDGNILVVEPHYQRVNRFSPEGRLLGQWGEKGTNVGQLTLPRSIACDTNGRVYVSEYTLVDRVQAFDPVQGTGLLSFGRAGSAPGEFNRPEGLAIDRSNTLYVADSCNHRIQVFYADGTFLRSHGTPGSGRGELSYPYDISVDAQGRQFVCEFGNSRVQVFDATDQPVEILGGYGAGLGQFSNPWSLALDSRGNLYVADSGNHRVQKFIAR